MGLPGLVVGEALACVGGNRYNLAMLVLVVTPEGLDWVGIAVLGFVAGILGGMLGVGGSLIMIPGLHLLLGPHQHLYQAGAMIANVAVALPAAWHHRRAGAMVPRVLKWMLPAALVFVCVGVAMSNAWFFRGQDGGVWLGRLLALFIVYVIYVNIRRLLADRPGDPPRQPIDTPARSGAVGGVMGIIAGLMGIGGGAIAVPMQQMLLRLPLRSCIANSSAIICVSASLGAAYKTATLAQHDYAWQQALWLALLLAPTCFIGGRLGAVLTHRLPVRQVRVAFILLMIVAGWRMAQLPWSPLAFIGL